MDKKDLKYNNQQVSAMEAFRKNQKQIEEIKSAIGLPQGVLKAVNSLNVFKQSTAFESVQKMAKEFSYTSPLSKVFMNPQVKSAMDSLRETIASNPSLFQSLYTDSHLMSTFSDTNKILQHQKNFGLISELYNESGLGELRSSMLSSTEFFKQYEQFKKSSSFRILSSLNADLFRQVLTTDLTTSDIEEFSESSLAEIDNELSAEIQSGKDFSLYSEKAKKILYYFCTVILLQYSIGIASSMSVNYIQRFKEVPKTLETSREVKSFVRSSPPLINRQALKGYRVTTVNTLNFRDNFGMKSTIIDTLPIGTVVRVIDKSDKSWLLVEVEIDGELEQGWVLRRYTTYFK